MPHSRNPGRSRQVPRLLVGLALAAALTVVCSGLLASASRADSTATEKLCVTAYPGANQKTEGNSTLLNRQASVRAVACSGFGFDTGFHVDGGIVCALTAAAIGPDYHRLDLFVSSGCNSHSLATHGDVGAESGSACSMLSDLLSLAKWARTYATAAGLACAFGGPTGQWIESESEHQAAIGVIQKGKCLRFTTHSFPLTDDWSAVTCAAGDPGFSDLFVAVPKGSGTAGTKVIETAAVTSSYQPATGLHIEDRGVAEECEAGSDSVGNAYRCFGRHVVYDPCWDAGSAGGDPVVLCQARPWEKRAYRLRVEQGGLEPFYGPPLKTGVYEPWGVELANGERCVAAQGAHGAIGRRIIDYGCETAGGKSDDRLLLRGIDRSHPRWRITTGTYDVKTGKSRVGQQVEIAKAWYAMQDRSDEKAAASNTCSASALAFAAEAYEAAHNEPHGPLPDLVGHGCSGGYAIALFIQEAPSPGYEAAFALRSTTSGWRVTGSADFIGPGEFGIPEGAYEEIQEGLSETGDEKLPF
jgi:hypothetical protein